MCHLQEQANTIEQVVVARHQKASFVTIHSQLKFTLVETNLDKYLCNNMPKLTSFFFHATTNLLLSI